MVDFIASAAEKLNQPELSEPLQGSGAMLCSLVDENAYVGEVYSLDKADLPNSMEALRVRVETAQRVSGEVERHWDDRGVMDPMTHNILSYAGVRCRVLGTLCE